VPESLPIRVLLIEDEPAKADEIAAACTSAIDSEAAVTVAADDEQATLHLSEEDFDLVVYDLAGGVELFREIGASHPGIPVVICASPSDLGVISELMAAGRREDVFGTDGSEPMVSFHPQDRLDDCIANVQRIIREYAELSAVEISLEEPLELETSETRALQIFARRTGAARAEVTGLSGGLSGAKTVVVDACAAGGMRTAHVVGKLSSVSTIPAAVDGYENAIPDLPAGLGAALAGVVTAGAGNTGAVFYRLADDYRRNWFDCLAESPEDAAEAVRRLHGRFAERYGQAPVEPISGQALRRGVVPDDWLAEAPAEVPDISEIESLELTVRRGIQHGDFHGLNVLVSDTCEPLLIDYDNYAVANCALDPVTLELSALFHRDEGAQAARQGWPDPETAARWFDLDAYVAGCPYPEAIRACRAWAVDAAADERELAATLWAVALRQLCFENTDKALANVMIEAGAAALQELGA
jgi:DNA-binding NarL/FixJ family response regulator